MGNTTSLVLGFPIRTSSDQSSVGSSPRLIAASYVLHRLLVPRHSPCALKNLANKIAKTSPTRKIERGLFRCSQPLFRSQSPHPTTKQGDNTMCCLRTQQCASVPIPSTVRRLADYLTTFTKKRGQDLSNIFTQQETTTETRFMFPRAFGGENGAP